MPIRLYQAKKFEDAWESLLRPWFARHVARAWKAEPSVAVVVPTAATLAYLKKRLLESGMNTFGLSFLTPSALRNRLLRAWPPARKVALREDLRLIMSLAAEPLLGNTAVTSIAHSPDAFVRTCDRLEASGWGPEGFGSDSYQAVAVAYHDSLLQFGMQTLQSADFELWRKSEERNPLFQEVMLYGFSDRHWRHFALLRASLNTTAYGHCVLLDGGVSESSQIWLGTWEEIYGVSDLLIEAKDPSDRPYRNIALSLEDLVRWKPSEDGGAIIYRIAENSREEADAIVAQALAFLGEPKGESVGIIFARPSALSREVSIRLAQLRIAHYDAFGHRPGQNQGQGSFDAWIRFQEDQKLDLFLDFLNQLSLQGTIEAKQADRLRGDLNEAFGMVLTDEFPILSAFLKEVSRNDRILSHLHRWPSLPERGPMESLWNETEAALQKIGWPLPKKELKERIKRLLESGRHQPVTRRSFLRWLREVTHPPERTHSRAGKNPFARVSLLSIDDVNGHDWSHLIFAEMSAQAWAGKRTAGAELSENEIERLNHRVVTMGRQGEGHLQVTGRHSYLLSLADERIHQFSRLTCILETTREQVAVTFARFDQSDPRKVVVPSDWLFRLHWVENGDLLDESRSKQLAAETRLWLASLRSPGQGIDPAIERTVIAYCDRRKDDLPFGGFEFSYESPPIGGLQLSATAWDELLRRPASVWLKHIVGVTQRQYFSENWHSAQTVGKWAHAWLRPPNEEGDFGLRPGWDQWLSSIQRKAESVRHTVTRSYEACGRKIPDWWLADWNQALSIAQQAAREISGIRGWPLVSGEFTIPKGKAIRLPGGEKIKVPGRIDLLLAQAIPWLDQARKSWVEEVPAWVIDLKTGRSARALTRDNFRKGNGLQLGFYALALREFGCREVEMSLLNPESPLRVQLDLNDLLEIPEFWQGLTEIARSGALGQLGPIRSIHAYTGAYPLTTLAIDPALLERKWALTHPLLCTSQ